MRVDALNLGNPSYARSRLKRKFHNTPLLCDAPANPNPRSSHMQIVGANPKHSPEGKGVRLRKVQIADKPEVVATTGH